MAVHNSIRGPSISSYQALKGYEPRLSSRAGAGRPAALLRATSQHRPNIISKPLRPSASHSCAKNGRGETKRRTARAAGREHVSDVWRPAACRRTSSSCAPPVPLRQCARVCAAGLHTCDLGWRHGATVEFRRDRSAQDAAQVDSTRGVPIDGCEEAASRGGSGAGGTVRRVLMVAGFSHFTLLLVHALRPHSRGCGYSLYIPHRLSHRAIRTRLRSGGCRPAQCVINPRSGRRNPRRPSAYGQRVRLILETGPTSSSPRSSFLSSRRCATTTANPETDLLAQCQQLAGTHTGSIPIPTPVGHRRLGGCRATRRHHHA